MSVCRERGMCVKARDKCIKIIEQAEALGFKNEITEGKLANIIINARDTADDRAIRNWTRALVALGFIEEKAPHVYKINNRTET